MTPDDVLALLSEHGAVRHGHFRLSSGLHSDTYVQCALVCQWPDAVHRLGAVLAERVRDREPTAVCGPAMGGVIIAHEVARSLGVRMVFSERVDGEMGLRRGFEVEGERVVVVEDVVTTGRSPREAVSTIRAAGADVVAVGAIVDRSKGVDLGVPFTALVRVEADAWEPDACPRCADGEPLSTPGSRYAAR